MIDSAIIDGIKRKFQRMSAELDERGRRFWAANEAIELGYGGINAVAQATGLGISTIHRGCKDIRQDNIVIDYGKRRVRQPGGGRNLLSVVDPDLVNSLEALVSPTTRGDPMSPLRWTCKSTRKCLEGASHPDRNAQFRYINRCVKVFQRARQPIISVDAKKKEQVGVFTNKGCEYQPKGKPEQVQIYDFPDPKLGKVCPYGVYDPTHNQGWVSVGVDHDTAEFAVESIRRWWKHMGKVSYPQAKALLITADGGGSNASRNRLWKVELQKFANETGLAIYVRHFPPGTSKWNKIEHRMFSYITENWRGRPLVSREVIVNLIGHTTTDTGLSIQAELDENTYPSGIKVSDEELRRVNLTPAKFHGKDWNYAIKSSQ